MKVWFVGAGPGDPDLLTVKAMNLLRTCKLCVYAGSLVGEKILEIIPESAEKIDSASLSLNQIVSIFQEARQQGVDVVRLHSGDPSIYGAIGEQMRELDRMSIGYEVVPGVSSFQAAAAALHVELTAPEVSQTIILTRASGRTPLPAEQELHLLAQSRATLCIFLSIHKIEDIAKSLAAHYGSQCPAAVVYHASRPDQQIVKGTLANIGEKVAEQDIQKTAMIIVGHALSMSGPASKLYDPTFSHEFRQHEELP